MALALAALSPVTVQGDLREPLALKAAIVAAGVADLEVIFEKAHIWWCTSHAESKLSVSMSVSLSVCLSLGSTLPNWIDSSALGVLAVLSRHAQHAKSCTPYKACEACVKATLSEVIFAALVHHSKRMVNEPCLIPLLRCISTVSIRYLSSKPR